MAAMGRKERAASRPEMPENLVSVAEAAKATGYSRATIYTWICKKQIRKFKCGKFVAVDKADIQKYISQKSQWKEVAV